MLAEPRRSPPGSAQLKSRARRGWRTGEARQIGRGEWCRDLRFYAVPPKNVGNSPSKAMLWR